MDWPYGFGFQLERWMLWHPLDTLRDLLRYPFIRWIRGGKGWHYTDVFSLDQYLATWLPGALRELANSPGYPMTFSDEEWRAQLEKAALALEEYAGYAGLNNAERYAAAQEAMHWIADNFGALWW